MSQRVDERSGEPAPHTELDGSVTTAGGSPLKTLRKSLRKWKFWILLGGITVVVLAAIFMLRTGGGDRGILSPGNPAPDGAMATAQILREQGVDIEVADTLEQTLQQLESAGTENTILLVHDRLGLLEDPQLEKLADASARTVLVEPSVAMLSAFAQDIHAAGVVPSADDSNGASEADSATISPQCRVDHPRAAGPIDGGGSAYRGPVMCYLLQNEQAGPSALFVKSADGDVTVVGNGNIISNERLRFHGNAALTLRTLGAEPNLVWYQPSLADTAIHQNAPELGELLPPWVRFAGIWLAIAAVLGVLWQARRRGPLVLEPLPVIAKAAETAEGRARLYQDSRAVHRAAENLRAGTLARMASHFRLGAGAPAEAVARAVASGSSLSEHDVGRILLRHRPETDAELLEWAQELDHLEKEATAK
ncbi:DUF4350 domain-containing protein [Arthrobacter castelli]|uniref:DUF4350 domain-containing protein n=1 Tax=Arthrobacter castelli TaxID=271431 RepID=UPI00041EB947|nr:DUF4350 domain-containing protein [Arthrobacter castelli]